MYRAAPTLPRNTEVWLLLAVPLLAPFGMAFELPILIGAVLGLIQLLRRRVDWRAPGPRIALLLGLCYWLPELASAPDSLAARKTWAEAALDLRFIPFLIFAAGACRLPGAASRLRLGITLIAAFWCLDALLQAATGWSLGGHADSDRLSGIFGDDNLKLGGAMALLAPFALQVSLERGRWPLFAVTALVLLVVILLAGARAAWVSHGLAVLLTLWASLGLRKTLWIGSALLVTGSLIAALGYQLSPRFAQRVDRTLTALDGDREAIDHALSGRLDIWQTALHMGTEHPINGVGIRAFRHAYVQHAAADDAFVDASTGQGALHAHQIVLELWSETGSIGLMLWLAACMLAFRFWQQRPPDTRTLARPASIALLIALFPINTHYAIYSAFWGALLIWLCGVWLALLERRES